MRAAVTRVASQAVPWAVVVLLAAATTAGFADRVLQPDGTPYLLVTRETGDHPLAVVAFFVATLALYAAAVRWCRTLADRWRDGATSGAGDGRVARFTGWAYSRWWRMSLALGAIWLPVYATSFPGQPSPDAANMFSEFLQTRSDFAGAPALGSYDQTAPYLDYPTSSYLLTDGDSMWSNHHPLFLMLTYGAICALSIAAFQSLVPAIVLISALSAAFTLVAFGRALTILGTLVESYRHRLLALAVTAATLLIPLWSMAEHKNQIFCAAFVWWLALLARFLHSPGAPGRQWYAETVVASLLIAGSVQFGWFLLVAQAVALAVAQRRRVVPLLAVGLPALAVFGSVTAATAVGLAIASDPIETKGVQLQTLALVLREHPDVLTAEERADLERIFDLDALVAAFDPSSSDPLKSTGPFVRKTASFRYDTVRAEDWDSFNSIVLAVAARHPGTALDALFLKSYRYLDPLDEGTDWYPPWNPRFDRSVDGYRVAPVALNLRMRGDVRTLGENCFEQQWCRPVVSHSTRTVVVLLLLAGAIAARRRHAWIWMLPFALQLAIAGISPLSAGGRYTLAFSYGLGVVLLLLAAGDRRGAALAEDPAVPEVVGDHPHPHGDELGARSDHVV